MKAILILVVLVGLGSRSIESGNSTAQKIQGLDVYVYADPVKDYDVIESGKIMITLTGGCGELVNQAVKKAAKQRADGVIVHLDSDKWEAIKYK